MSTRERVREVIRTELAKHRPLDMARQPLELIAESSVRFTGEDGFEIVDEAGAPRTTTRDGAAVPFTLPELVAELTIKHPKLFAPPVRDGAASANGTAPADGAQNPAGPAASPEAALPPPPAAAPPAPVRRDWLVLEPGATSPLAPEPVPALPEPDLPALPTEAVPAAGPDTPAAAPPDPGSDWASALAARISATAPVVVPAAGAGPTALSQVKLPDPATPPVMAPPAPDEAEAPAARAPAPTPEAIAATRPPAPEPAPASPVLPARPETASPLPPPAPSATATTGVAPPAEAGPEATSPVSLPAARPFTPHAPAVGPAQPPVRGPGPVAPAGPGRAALVQPLPAPLSPTPPVPVPDPAMPLAQSPASTVSDLFARMPDRASAATGRPGLLAASVAGVLALGLLGYLLLKPGAPEPPAPGPTASVQPAPAQRPAAQPPAAQPPAAQAPLPATPPQGSTPPSAQVPPAPAPAAPTPPTSPSPAPVRTVETGPVRGVPEVVDTGTLRIEGRLVRLFGVEWARGGESGELSNYLRGREVACQPAGPAGAYRCTVEGQDLSRVVLFNGGGRATSEASPELVAAEERARQARIGVWRR